MPKYIDLADKLDHIADLLPVYSDADKTDVYSDGIITIRCIPQRDALQAIAAKYRKGGNFNTKIFKDYGVAGCRLNAKTIESRYSDDDDKQQFMELLKCS